MKESTREWAVQRKIHGHEHEGSVLTLVEFENLMEFIVDKTGTNLILAIYKMEKVDDDDLLPGKKSLLMLSFKRAYSSKKIEKILNDSSIREFSFHEDRRKFNGVDYAFESWEEDSIKDWTDKPGYYYTKMRRKRI